MLPDPTMKYDNAVAITSKNSPRSERLRIACRSELPLLEQQHVRDDVVVDHDDHQRCQKREADLLNALLHADGEIAPRDTFDKQDHDVAAVEHRNREEIDDSELQRNHRH